MDCKRIYINSCIVRYLFTHEHEKTFLATNIPNTLRSTKNTFRSFVSKSKFYRKMTVNRVYK